MIRKVLKYPDERLAIECEDITEITDEIRQLAADMAETMYREEGIGLAAPQVGESCRLIVVDVSGPEERKELMTLINPCLDNMEGEVDSEEGCLSVVNYRSKITRAEKVRLNAKDLNGNDICMDADGLLAICLQHEIDHLNGVLFIDRISRLKRTMYDNKVKKWLKK
ncbi:peptide deformylase [Desulfovibrio mangrovi]|uniref:peptide deformylase n=1 Tax=Desulfovibrio mangrovi TaxID=2976983 RepID=UPI002247A023|nr:peptide deformylase [Desulfovibrio mangrovi]UZP66564.1 peptide deformylase [Desulfovibrio mangrovi]